MYNSEDDIKEESSGDLGEDDPLVVVNNEYIVHERIWNSHFVFIIWIVL